jgi:hypothetical protein
MKYLKLFENYNDKSVFIITHDEFSDLCKKRVVEPDSSGNTNFSEFEDRYSLPLKELQKIFEDECNKLFSENNLHKSHTFFDRMYGSGRSVEIEYRYIRKSPNLNVRCDIWEIQDEWFLGYFTFWGNGGHKHKYFKCDQTSGVENIYQELKDEVKHWVDTILTDKDDSEDEDD